MSELSTRIQLKRDTAANWAAVAETFTLLPGELGFETDTGLVKIGTGAKWGATPYISIDSYTKVGGLTSFVAGAVGAEAARAQESEAALSSGLSDEIVDRTAQDDALSGEISSLRKYADDTFETLTAAAAEHKELSDALTAEIDRAKADEQVISAALTAEIDRAKADEQAISTALDNAVTAIYDGFVKYTDVSGGKSAVTTDNPIATLRDIVGLSGVVHFRGASETFDGKTVKPDDVDWYKTHDPTAGDIVINTTSSVEYLYDGTQWREMGSEGIWAKQADLQLSVQNLETADAAILTALADETKAREDADKYLSGEISSETDRASAAEAVLSVAIDGKVKVKKIGGDAISTDLSVVELSEEDYMAKVAAGDDLVADGVMYVMKPEGGYAFNAYNQKIVGVATPTADTDAANKAYVDSSVSASELTAIELNGLSFSISDNKATLDISAINCGTASAVV